VTAYHAIHESPYADDCPDCAGYEEPEPEPHNRARVVVFLLALVAWAAGVIAAVRHYEENPSE
jgi:hypothetical protein